MLKVAMLGTGRIADTQLAPAISVADGVQLWSVLSRAEDRARAFSSRHGAGSTTPAYTDVDALLRDPELDAVVVATPDRLHARQAMSAMRAGKHVLVEKPMATSSHDAEEMVRVAAETHVVLGVAYHLRWHDGHRRMRDAVRSGRLGNLRHMRLQWTWPAPDASNWRAHPDVGRWWSLAGVGTHLLDLVRWMMVPTCGEVEFVAPVVTRSVYGGPHDETAVVALGLADGATAELCSSVLFRSPSRIEIYGSGGYVIGTDTLGPLGGGTIEGSDGPWVFEPANPYVGEVLDFADAIRNGRSPEVDGREGCRNVALLERIA